MFLLCSLCVGCYPHCPLLQIILSHHFQNYEILLLFISDNKLSDSSKVLVRNESTLLLAVNFVLYTITIIIISRHIGTYTLTHTAIVHIIWPMIITAFGCCNLSQYCAVS